MKDTSVLDRKTRLLEQLLRLPQDVPTPLVEFVRAAGLEMRLNDGPPDDRLSERQVKYAIQEAEEHVRPLQVCYESGNIVLRQGEGTAYLRRSRREVDTKRKLAHALWTLLLGENWRGSTLSEKVATTTKLYGARKLLSAKILHLRRRNQLYFAADAGTTTLQVVRELLTAERMPIEVWLDQGGILPMNEDSESTALEKSGTDSNARIRMIEPVMLTNSYPAAQAVIDSEKHRLSMKVDFIGGSSRPGRNCTTGELTNLWLRTCCALGIVGTLDLAIIGVTGAFIGANAVAFAACDDQDEATLKSKLLEMATGDDHRPSATGLRVLIFHSAKLFYPEARCRFSTITQAMVDLVVMDSGTTPEEKKVVMNFTKTIMKSGVGTLLVDTQK